MRNLLSATKSFVRGTFVYQRYVKRKAVQRLLRANLEKINFGCGRHPLPGWVNTDGGDGRYWKPFWSPDIINLDVWTFLAATPPSVARFVTSEQFFEHFTRQEGHRLIREWYRILKPGGVLRIQTVDLEKEIQVYL